MVFITKCLKFLNFSKTESKMTAEMRDMINQLMGTNRAVEEGRLLVPYNHHTVCRAFLLGCCPHEILADTRLESLVACNKVSSQCILFFLCCKL